MIDCYFNIFFIEIQKKSLENSFFGRQSLGTETGILVYQFPKQSEYVTVYIHIYTYIYIYIYIYIYNLYTHKYIHTRLEKCYSSYFEKMFRRSLQKKEVL